MTREELEKIYQSAYYIFKQSRLADVRRHAKSIAVAIENHIGLLASKSADTWEV